LEKPKRSANNFPERSCVPFDPRAVRVDGEDRVKKGTDRDDIVNAMRLFECMPFAEAEKVLVEPLSFWLQDSPEFDPEGCCTAS
jgi:hypothetical protein